MHVHIMLLNGHLSNLFPLAFETQQLTIIVTYTCHLGSLNPTVIPCVFCRPTYISHYVRSQFLSFQNMLNRGHFSNFSINMNLTRTEISSGPGKLLLVNPINPCLIGIATYHCTFAHTVRDEIPPF